MTTRVNGKGAFDQFIAGLPAQLEQAVARGAIADGAEVIAEEWRLQTNSEEVRASIEVHTKVEPGIAIATIGAFGPGAYLAPWEEFGTDPHLIAVDDDVREGFTVRRLNDRVKEGSLVIGGKFVGKSIQHPGAKPHPALRPALDSKQDEAVRIMGESVGRRLAKRSAAGAGA